MKNIELDHRTGSREQNLLMHMMHAMLVHMIFLLFLKELLGFYLLILEILSIYHMWKYLIKSYQGKEVQHCQSYTREKENNHPMDP